MSLKSETQDTTANRTEIRPSFLPFSKKKREQKGSKRSRINWKPCQLSKLELGDMTRSIKKDAFVQPSRRDRTMRELTGNCGRNFWLGGFLFNPYFLSVRYNTGLLFQTGSRIFIGEGELNQSFFKARRQARVFVDFIMYLLHTADYSWV